jgi:cohesin loading factor subunit SCC2
MCSASSKSLIDQTDNSDTKQPETLTAASAAIARHRPLQTAFDPILNALINSMDLQAVALRSKALRGLSAIIQVDPDVLALPNVRQAFEARLSDSSPAVRDSAIDLVGKYMIQKPSLAAEYYPHIALRVHVSICAITLIVGYRPGCQEKGDKATKGDL